jgi:5-methylcytosine-specific restriction endonuclease McrA
MTGEHELSRMSASKRLRLYFEQRVGIVVTSKELQAAAGDVSEWARRVRELRDEHGLQILTHNDREDLSPGQYVLVSLERRPVVARTMSSKLRRQILARDGGTCQICGSAAGEDSGCEPGKKCLLEIDHVLPISQGGTDDPSNLRAVCKYFNKDKADVIKPASGQAIAALATIRKLPRDIQREVFDFLKRKFDSNAGAGPA